MEGFPSQVNLIDLSIHWVDAGSMSQGWRPTLYHCGAYDSTRDCFPVLRDHHHIIYIPATSKPVFRFLQHAMYGLWYMSLCPRFNTNTKANFFRGSAYLHFIRQAFFTEVQDKFYPPADGSMRQVLPTCNKMTRQWFSGVLFSWALITYHTGRICPPASDWLPPDDGPVSVKFGKCYICFWISGLLTRSQTGRLGLQGPTLIPSSDHFTVLYRTRPPTSWITLQWSWRPDSAETIARRWWRPMRTVGRGA
jgi:hypothetical protein